MEVLVLKFFRNNLFLLLFFGVALVVALRFVGLCHIHKSLSKPSHETTAQKTHHECLSCTPGRQVKTDSIDKITPQKHPAIVYDAPKAAGYENLTNECTINGLPITGSIPKWLDGLYIYNGPAQFSFNDSSFTYCFDGFAMLHKFDIKNGAIAYTNKFVRSQFYQKAMQTGTIAKNFLAGNNNHKKPSWFSKMAALMATPPMYDNTNVHTTVINNQLVALTETPHHLVIDPETLTTKGPLLFNDKLEGHVCTAHYLQDQKTNVLYNVLTHYGNTSLYHIYKIEPGSTKRTLITSIPAAYPSFMHSFTMTHDYIILTVSPFTVNPFDLLGTSKPFLLNFKWNGDQKTEFIVINKKDPSIQLRYQTDAFFTFHHVNAFEQADRIIIDLIAYETSDIVHNFSLANARSCSCNRPGTLYRYTINQATNTVTKKLISSVQLESPRINQQYTGIDYSFAYAIDAHDQRILKINMHDSVIQTWTGSNCYPNEAIFVANPHGKQEDDGVLLSTVFDAHNKKSFLLVLDGHSMKEIARARLPHHIPFGFHGNFFNRNQL